MEPYKTSQLLDDQGQEFLLIPCVVISEPGAGPPCPVLVLCSQEAYDNGDHYELAADGATSYSWLSNAKTENTVVLDVSDGPAWLFEHFTPDEFVCVDADSNQVSVSGWGEDYQKPEVVPPTHEELLAVCKRLKEWESTMGGWDAPAWRDLETLLQRERGEPASPQPDFDLEGVVMYRCSDCGAVAEEDEFVPSDGNPSPHVCPACGLTNVFPFNPTEEI